MKTSMQDGRESNELIYRARTIFTVQIEENVKNLLKSSEFHCMSMRLFNEFTGIPKSTVNLIEKNLGKWKVYSCLVLHMLCARFY